MNIQAVFFDMGGTIETFGYTRNLRLAATPQIRHKLSSTGIDLHLSDEELYELISNGLKSYHAWSVKNIDERPSFFVWRDYIFKDYSIDPDTLEKISEELMMYTEGNFYHRAVRPEIPRVLEEIRQMGLKIGMISNINSKGLVPANLKKYGIFEYFNPIVLSSEYGRRKPDPAIFHYAARLADVPTGACVYVGDRITRDIAGARKAGYKMAVQIRHDFKHGENDTGHEPDAFIDNMNELLEILKEKLTSEKSSTNREKEVRALIFDAGDILYFRPEKGRNFQKFLTMHNLSDRQIPVENRKELKDQAFKGLLTQDQQYREILRLYGFTDGTLIEQGCKALENDNNNVQFFEGVRNTLITLKNKGLMLGIITDTANPLHVKLSWFEQGGFAQVWDSIISSREVGMKKPDQEIYTAALRQLGIRADQAAFVGHNPEELAGARRSGMKTIAFNYDDSAEADHFVNKFPDLLDLLFIPSED